MSTLVFSNPYAGCWTGMEFKMGMAGKKASTYGVEGSQLLEATGKRCRRCEQLLDS
jgi:hypothetical protein